jgi:hypothetical protein
LLVDNRQPVQIFICLCELTNTLFTRVKPQVILNDMLISLAETIEQLTELYAVSKSNMLPVTGGAAAPSTPGTPSNIITETSNSASPGQKKQQQQIQQHLSHVNSHFRFGKQTMVAVLQSTRKSNDLFDTFSMHVACYVQNQLPTVVFKHEFDSALLAKLEPIFYAFLTFPTKLSLKQKTLQAWNGTFGKSSVHSLSYSKRLEKLFVELREEMINSNSKSSSAQLNSTNSSMKI